MDTIDNAKKRLKKADFFCIKLKKKDVKAIRKKEIKVSEARPTSLSSYIVDKKSYAKAAKTLFCQHFH